MNVTDAIFDPELGCTIFTVERITYTRTRTGTTSSKVTSQATGCIHPGTPEMIQLLPEEERNNEFIMIYTDCALSVGIPEGNAAVFTGADQIGWNNRTWRVVRVRDWQMFGYYQAYAVLMRELS
jgi:hypothetical protein